MTTQDIFARKNEDGNYTILGTDEGYPVTQMEEPTIYPIGSDVSCCYEHPEGIILTLEQVEKIGIEIEDAVKQATPNTAYTIGYQGKRNAQFLEDAMEQHEIVKLFDIRSKPGANGKFGKHTLAKIFGNRYISRIILGGFDHEISEYEAWRSRGDVDIQAIVETLNHGPVLIMCFERNPNECHRKYFMGRALENLGINVVHL